MGPAIPLPGDLQISDQDTTDSENEDTLSAEENGVKWVGITLLLLSCITYLVVQKQPEYVVSLS
jgi:hypothetical protein